MCSKLTYIMYMLVLYVAYIITRPHTDIVAHHHCYVTYNYSMYVYYAQQLCPSVQHECYNFQGDHITSKWGKLYCTCYNDSITEYTHEYELFTIH